jgi:two-component system cell cycle response regulator CpdR
MMPGRILLADDDDLTRRNICGFLLEHGYQIREAANGAQALYLLQTEPFDLVISDIVMPWLDGREVVEVVRATSPKTPVLLITGHPSIGADSNETEVLLKPISLDDLLSRVRQMRV